ncbi:MAG: DUF5915 domain-containing protein, partial [Gemmatimonadales bacterium]
MRVAVPRAADGARLRQLLPLLAQEVNVRQVDVVSSDAGLVRLRARPNFRALGRRYGKRTPEAAAAAAHLSSEQLRALEAGQTVTLNGGAEGFAYGPGDVTVEREVTSDWLVETEAGFVVAIDPVLTDELRRDGLAREVVNRIQRLRKEAGYEYTDRITVWIDGDPALLDAVRSHQDFIQTETLARALHPGAAAPAGSRDREDPADVDGHPALIAIGRPPASDRPFGSRSASDSS